MVCVNLEDVIVCLDTQDVTAPKVLVSVVHKTAVDEVNVDLVSVSAIQGPPERHAK
jgi:hypothetical protein